MGEEKPTAFVIMAFDTEFEAIYSELIRPAFEQAGYDVSRADSLMNQQSILKDIVRQISSADIIIAELTSLNANVYYELGIAHALRKRTVLLTQSVEDLPFDLRSYRVVVYSVRFDEATKLKNTLAEIAERAKTNAISFGSPVDDFLPRGEALPATSAGAGDVVAAVPEPVRDEEKGLWDYVIESEESMQKSTAVITTFATAIQNIGEKMGARAEEMGRVKKTAGSGQSMQIYRLVESSASEISDFADVLESGLPQLHSAWEAFSESASGMMRIVKIKTQQDREAIQKYRTQLAELVERISGALAGNKRLIDSQAGLKGASKSMNRASQKAIFALEKVAGEFEIAISYCTKVIDLLDEQLHRFDGSAVRSPGA